VDLANYADLAVRLVNAVGPGQDAADSLTMAEFYRSLDSDRPYLNGRITAADTEAMRLLRGELRLIFAAASRHDDAEVIERINALLARHPIHPELSAHDGQACHLHLVASGSAADRYAAGAVAGLTALITESGASRLRVCAGADCERVFIDYGSAQDREFCSDHCLPKASVRTLRARERGRGARSASTAAS
jgi:predicted RNA-binding Zn ribbon-like protein